MLIDNCFLVSSEVLGHAHLASGHLRTVLPFHINQTFIHEHRNIFIDETPSRTLCLKYNSWSVQDLNIFFPQAMRLVILEFQFDILLLIMLGEKHFKMIKSAY